MLDVITVGTATRDVFLASPFKVLRDPAHLERIGFKTGEAQCFALGSKMEVAKPLVTTGGGAANAAITFRRQGFRTAALFKVGTDMWGDDVIADLARERVEVIAARDKQKGTAYSTILLAPDGERTVLVYRGASEDLARRDVPMSRLRARWAYLAPGRIEFSVIREIILHLKKNGTKIAMNPSKHYLETHGAHLKPLLKNLDVVIMNREEASYLTGVPYGKDRAIFKKIDDLVNGIVVVTDGANGARVSDGTDLYTAGTFREKKIVDRTGAGDAFGSGFVAGLLQKEDIHHALRLAAANATSVIEAIGAEPGILRKKDLTRKRWQYLNLDIDPL